MLWEKLNKVMYQKVNVKELFCWSDKGMVEAELKSEITGDEPQEEEKRGLQAQSHTGKVSFL